MNGIRLGRLAPSAKALVTALLAMAALNHAFAGWLTWEIANSAAGSAKEHFQYKNLVYLLRMSHQHTFGHGTMYFLVGGVFLLSSWPERVKIPLVLAPFLGALLDLGSWWLQKYAGADFEWLSMIGGALFALGFSVMSLRSFYELWFLRETRA